MPRTGPTHDRVVTEAKAFAEEVVLSEVTISALAGRLGVQQPSLYRHIDVTRALRLALHGFVTLETSGGFGLPVDIGCDFERLVRVFEAAMPDCTAEQIKTSGPT
jgi:DNA-binding transcriptional ArsR family regulator